MGREAVKKLVKPELETARQLFGVNVPPPEHQKPRPGVRRCFCCYKCTPPRRIFLLSADDTPRCEVHGRIDVQENSPFRGMATA